MAGNPRILIVGGGIAGIAAARRLFDHGYTNLTILEAENRIGGRINSLKESGSLFEFGAQWCHGEDGNEIYNLVKNLNLLDASFNDYANLTYYDSGGNKIDRTLTDALFGIFAQITYDEEVLKNEKGSFGDYFIRRYNEEIDKLFVDDSISKQKAVELMDWFHNFTLGYDGASSWFDISARGLLQYKECDGNLLLHWKRHGFSIIFDILMKKYPNESERLPILETIRFNTAVRNILWDSTEIKVTCSDGSTYSGDHLIFTASLGVLKENFQTMFTPELPLYKKNAITALGIDTLNKIFVQFSHKWWPDDFTGFSLVWNEQDRSKIVKEFPYGPVKNGASWLEGIYGFYVIDGDSRTLMGWNVGPFVKDVELIDDDIIVKGCQYLFNKFLGRTYEIPPPERVFRTKWFSNRNFRGSYSYRTVLSDEMNTSAEDLARPLSGKRGNVALLFAGEATHNCFYSTAHGALESGFREADRLIRLYEKPEEQTCRIAVIGCGMAGLGAACELSEAGIEDILILEATNEPGGRINSTLVNGNVIELGAQWLHGTSNRLHQLAVENGLLLDETSEEGLGMYVRNDGFIFDEFMVKKIDFAVGKILGECERFVDSPSDYPHSVGEYLAEEFRKYLEKSGADSEFKEMAWELFDWHRRFQIIDNSSLNLEQVSAKDWGKYSCEGSAGQKYMNLRGGYKSLVDVLLKMIPKNSVSLDTPALKVDYSNRKVRVKCRGGLTVFADHVIVTSSIGTLKQNLLQFHPPLPSSIATTIESLGFHGIGKVYLAFDRKWWKVDGFQIIWKKDAILEGDKRWLQCITGFDSVLNQPNILVGWVGGEGLATMESLPEGVVGKHCVELLRTFLKDPQIPAPIKVIRTTWTSNPWIRGAYSHTTPACDKAGCGPTTLAAPIQIDGVPRVMFAGEAAHPSHFSTTHGAFESGQQQARHLLKFLRKYKL